ncbi:hypothetical protein FHW83_005900 [Duganella sp. SG902]|uniref:YiiX/YebB-like N1pC/P60 family cysteine hydrolase n=1 Tax=Duganella sp. SG902 TaxID=2587016 RepID=UPI00159DDE61|nr:YiiX/YebB-like N1pC/P60 family cysteine hydrolase [Duganella sp. SG902]NVM80055.1 hypothetical protein [Duganella sp. SG902]
MSGAVRVIFSRSRLPVSVLIRTFLWDPWSHCGIVDGGEVVEANMFKGVSTRSLAEFQAAASEWEIIEIPCPDPAAVIAAARSRIGRRYDFLGALAMLLRIRLQRDDRDFCSELVAWAFQTAGYPLFRVNTWRINPRDLYIRTY